MSFLKLSCKKATEMVEQEKIESLSFVDKVKLKLHLSVCKACQGYQKQSQLIDSFFSRENHELHDNELGKDIPLEENPKLKEDILAKLNQKL
ncbi:MAG: hypothetical protein RQ875_00125 [Vicingaceae bacterium]|nr:hypothetical protein [Vicingaceae bacterium]